MITHVKHLIEELKKFNPDAPITTPDGQLRESVELSFRSPQTQCGIRLLYDEETETLKNQLDEAEESSSNLMKALENIESLIKRDDITSNVILKKVSEITNKHTS